MAHRIHRSLAAAAAGAIVLASSPLVASAQTGTYYTPPKLVKQATPTTPIAGTGAVTVQVFVKKTGQIGTVKIEKSTNHADDAVALEIARNSTYKPGMRDAKPVDAFYTMALKFSGSNVVNDTGTSSGQLVAANALIRAGKYAEAKSSLQSYLSAHPGDKDANALLGVADAFLDDNAGAAAAFDAAGTIPDRFKNVAAKAYSDAAVDALKAKNNDQAIALADKGLALQQNVNTLFIQGTAYANAQRYPQAIADLEKAKSMATAGRADAATLNAIDSSLATAYIFGGHADQGMALAKALKQRDPSNTRVDDTLASYYNQQAVAAMNAGKPDEAVGDLESAARAIPSRAVVLYVQAANILSNVKPTPDWKRVKAEADKALAVDGNDARANYVAGIALANSGDQKGALPYVQKAKANAGSDASLNADIDAALKKLGQK
ncbi:MAG TPA: tetratricopeptide repeat protein [Candidatus Elarobacter sp.]|jgi:tetratricopeptide (TPR) repeat protein|nr:tetratricopeptide repeat protein [Candidatus Elarobacter sp.]